MIKKKISCECLTETVPFFSSPIQRKYTLITDSREFHISTPDVEILKKGFMSPSAVVFAEWENKREDQEDLELFKNLSNSEDNFMDDFET
jgi:hypothetical protein